MYHQRSNNNEERRARLAIFVLELFPNIMQCSVSYCILKNRLSTKYCTSKRNPPVFTPTELLLIKQLPTVKNFTIQLCYKLISFEGLLPSPSNGWGIFPDSKAVKIEDDIERIRHVINEIIEINNNECTESYLVKFLYKLEQIIQRFQSALGNTNVLQTYKTLLIQNIDITFVLGELKHVGVIDSNVQRIKLQDRERYSKISAVITEFFPKILRNLIPPGITPSIVHTLCNIPSCKWDKSQSFQIQQLKLRQSYESLDASMLYQLFRRFSFVAAPTQGWGKDPTNCDFEIADDIERIRHLRNKSAHRCDTCIDQTEFDNYFLQFHEITHRVAVSYEHELTAIAEGSLDPNRQIALMEALQELEDMKERFKINPVSYYWGNDFQKKIEDIRQMIQSRKEIRGEKTPLIEKITIKIELQDINNAETREQILNELKPEINRGDFHIEFIGAIKGSLILYACASTEALTTDENLQTELSSFMTRILCKGKFEIPPSQWIDAVIFPVEDNKELPFNSSTTNSLSLQFNVKMDAFETDARLESEISACMQRTIKTINGNGFTESVTAIVEYMQSDDKEDTLDMVTSSFVPTDNIVEIDKESTVVSGSFDKDDTKETIDMETKQLIPVEKNVEIEKEGTVVPGTFDKEIMAEIPRNEIRLVLIGKTGNGKSSSCNTIIGKEVFPFGCDNNGVTTTSSVRYAKRFGKLICLVDTQGQNNEYYQKEIKKCINFTTPGPHAIILVVHLNRFTVEDVETVNHFCAHFGGNVEKYVIVLFTRFDDMKREMEKKSNHTGMRGFIENLKPPLKEFLSKCGNRYIEFDNTLGGTSADSQVQRLLDIVDNMVRENGGLHYTNEDYEIAEKELQRQAMEIKKKNDQDGMKIEEKMINSLSDIRKQYEQKQQELQRCRRNLVDAVISHGRKSFGW